MAVKVLELHHHGIRIGPGEADLKKALHFYRDVLGLQVDEGRPEIRGVPGYWVYVGDTAQIHLMGAAGLSPAAKGQGMDPTITHVALAVPDVQEAKKELDRLGAKYWTIQGLVGEYEQIFLYDPFGNMVELHQIGTCRCVRPSASPAGG